MRIIYFDIDCLRTDHLGCYGYNRPTSPNIDAIAEEGTCFENYYCNSSPCLPSRTGWISGRFGVRNGVCSNVGEGSNFNFRKKPYGGPEDDNEMFPRQLRRNGFDTISISNFADRHSAYYFMCGWSEFHTPNLKAGNETAVEVNDVVFRWLRNNVDRDNYFLHINFWDTHRIYKMSGSWADRFKDYPVQLPWPDENTIQQHQSIKGPFTANRQFTEGRTPPPLMPRSISNRKDFEQMITAYDASIAYVDYHIGLITDFLKENSLWEDTAIIISSDHGDAFGEHGIYTDHVCADECIHHIPLIVRWPNVAKKGHKCNSLLYNVDFAPTICDILGYSIPEDWDGISFKKNLEARNGLEREYLVWDHGLYTVQRAVRTRDYLMIRTYDDFGYGMQPLELYQITKDPYQTENLVTRCPDVVEKCNSLLQEWLYEQQMKGKIVFDPLLKILAERSCK